MVGKDTVFCHWRRRLKERVTFRVTFQKSTTGMKSWSGFCRYLESNTE